MDTVKPLQGTLRQIYEKTLAYILEKFGDWSATHVRRRHQPHLAAAIFDDEKRDALFEDGFCEGDLRVKQDQPTYAVSQVKERYFTETAFTLLDGLHNPRKRIILNIKRRFNSILNNLSNNFLKM
jgi:hypothetical protein